MLLFQALTLSETPTVGLIAMAVALLLGILAPALCEKLKTKLCLLAVFLILAAMLEGSFHLLMGGSTLFYSMRNGLRIIGCVLTPFTGGLFVGTFIQLIRQLIKKKEPV